jgi:hypothetical protein
VFGGKSRRSSIMPRFNRQRSEISRGILEGGHFYDFDEEFKNDGNIHATMTKAKKHIIINKDDPDI